MMAAMGTKLKFLVRFFMSAFGEDTVKQRAHNPLPKGSISYRLRKEAQVL